jgi:hypothetical protein
VRKIRNAYLILVGNLNGADQLGYQDVDGLRIVKLI